MVFKDGPGRKVGDVSLLIQQGIRFSGHGGTTVDALVLWNGGSKGGLVENGTKDMDESERRFLENKMIQ